METAIYYIDQFKWPVTIIIVAIYLRHLWRKAGKEIEKERKEAQTRFMEKMSCKKCGGMMSLGSMKYCFRCEPYGPPEWYQSPMHEWNQCPPSGNIYDAKPLNRLQKKEK